MTDSNQNLRLLEAFLFAMSEPVGEDVIAAQFPEGTNVKTLLAELAAQYEGRGVNLVRVAGKWTLRTAPDLAEKLQVERTVHRRLSRAAVETLAIIAYHQPVTRAEIEEIRGRALSAGTLEILLENGWIQPKGRRHTPGRPTTWGTTEAFLVHFQLGSIDDLPGIEELKAAGLLDTRAARLVTQGNLAADEIGDAESDEPDEGDEEADEPLDTESDFDDEHRTAAAAGEEEGDGMAAQAPSTVDGEAEALHELGDARCPVPGLAAKPAS